MSEEKERKKYIELWQNIGKAPRKNLLWQPTGSVNMIYHRKWNNVLPSAAHSACYSVFCVSLCLLTQFSLINYQKLKHFKSSRLMYFIIIVIGFHCTLSFELANDLGVWHLTAKSANWACSQRLTAWVDSLKSAPVKSWLDSFFWLIFWLIFFRRTRENWSQTQILRDSSLKILLEVSKTSTILLYRVTTKSFTPKK